MIEFGNTDKHKPLRKWKTYRAHTKVNIFVILIQIQFFPSTQNGLKSSATCQCDYCSGIYAQKSIRLGVTGQNVGWLCCTRNALQLLLYLVVRRPIVCVLAHFHIFPHRYAIHVYLLCSPHPDIEAQILDIQAKKKEVAAASNDKGVGLLEAGYFDSEFYDEGGADKRSRYDGYMTSIAANDDADEEEDEGLPTNQKRSYTAPKAVLKDIVQVRTFVTSMLSTRVDSHITPLPQAEKDDFDPFADRRRPTVAEKEDEYRQKRRRLVISPDRADPFADGSYHPQSASITIVCLVPTSYLHVK